MGGDFNVGNRGAIKRTQGLHAGNHLARVEHEALVEILRGWPEIDKAVRAYEAYRPVAAPTWLGKSARNKVFNV